METLFRKKLTDAVESAYKSTLDESYIETTDPLSSIGIELSKGQDDFAINYSESCAREGNPDVILSLQNWDHFTNKQASLVSNGGKTVVPLGEYDNSDIPTNPRYFPNIGGPTSSQFVVDGDGSVYAKDNGLCIDMINGRKILCPENLVAEIDIQGTDAKVNILSREYTHESVQDTFYRNDMLISNDIETKTSESVTMYGITMVE